MSETILLVDDDMKMKSIVAEVLGYEGFTMLTAMNGQDAMQTLERNNVDLVLLDIQLPDIDGIELLKKCVHMKPSVPVVMITGFPTIDRAVTATKLGAYNFLEKPLEPQRVLLTIRNALDKSRLERSQDALVKDMMQRYGVIGISEALRKLCATASRIARTESPVLITGESGTGKELVANVIHQLSGRKAMVCVNCAAVPRDLIESELFGHRKGSFTGAVADKIGKFQAADGGTLFLDEIGDMSLEMQAKILRALETKEVSMVGGNETAKVDVRFIAATNKNIAEEIQQGRFREDLFYRLRGVTIHLPVLRDRPEDIRPIAQYILQKACEERELAPKQFTENALSTLQQHTWPGNVRELKHVFENLVTFSEDEAIDHLQVLTLFHSLGIVTAKTELQLSDFFTAPSKNPSSSFKATRESYEKQLILEALQETRGNITHAAEKLSIDRATLSKKIKRYGLK